MQAIQNLGLAVIALTAGIIVDKNGYLILEVFFMAWLCSKFHVAYVTSQVSLPDWSSCVSHLPKLLNTSSMAVGKVTKMQCSL